MKVTFLIGNGFDVNLGINSSYSKFYDWYCKRSSMLGYINEFKENIKNDMDQDVPDEEKTWADFEVGLGKYTTHFSAESASQFLDCYEDAQEDLVRYLGEQVAQINIQAVSDDALAAFSDTILNFYQELPTLELRAVDAVCNGIQNENREISLISFNYTGVLDEILKRLPSTTLKKWKHGNVEYVCRMNTNVVHVHGTTSEFPILGVDADSQIINTEFLNDPRFREVMIKAECVEALGHVWHQQAEQLISQSRIVCVFGMSLGETDAKWWRKLAQWLKTDGNRHIIIHWYERNPPDGISVRKQLEAKNKVIGKFLSYSELTDKEKSAIRPRIHVIINTKKFLKIPQSEFNKNVQEDIVPIKELALV